MIYGRFFMRNFSKLLTVFILLSLSLFCFTACKSGTERSSYDLSIKYNEGKIDGKLSYKFVNSHNTTFDHLIFNLHANAYKQGAKHRPVTTTSEAKAYPNGLSYGEIAINSVKANEQNLSYEIFGEDGQFLKINTGEIKHGKSILVDVDFTTILPDSTLRLGKTSHGVNLADFFPTACKIEDGKFLQINYSPLGDPYFADLHDYSVDLTVPSEYTVASSGFPTLTEVDGVYTTYSYELIAGRDFAFALSKGYEVYSKIHDGVTYTYYGLRDDGEEMLNQMIDCASYFSSSFGAYPYKSLSLAECELSFGGMEYSGLCFINEATVKEDKIRIIAHEIAHEWWHSAVGNNQNTCAYIDEGLAEYSTYLYLLKNHGEDKAKQMINTAKLAYKSFFSIEETLLGAVDTTMERELSSFKNEYEYSCLAYNKSLIMFYEYGKAIGEDSAIKALAKLYKENLNGDLNLERLTKVLGHTEHFTSFIEGKVLM